MYTNQFKIDISLLWIASSYFRMVYMLSTTINCDWLIGAVTDADTFHILVQCTSSLFQNCTFHYVDNLFSSFGCKQWPRTPKWYQRHWQKYH